MYTVMKALAFYGLVGAVAVLLARQVRKPNRWVGKPFLWLMNMSHSDLTDWGLQHISIEPQFTILDVGCGGGRTIQKLSGIATDGLVCGVDYASGSVATSCAKNSDLINEGRVEIHQASVSQLPFATDKFDLATAVETQYYWPNLVNDMKEVRRVLKAGGYLIVIAETYKGGKYDALKAPVMKLLKSTHLSVEDQRALFTSAGFDQIQTFEQKKHGWICVVGRKPSLRE